MNRLPKIGKNYHQLEVSYIFTFPMFKKINKQIDYCFIFRLIISNPGLNIIADKNCIINDRNIL